MEDGFWKGKRVLVTGCTGFLGAWLVMFLLRKGARVVGIIRDRTAQGNFYLSGLDESTDIVYGTISDYATVERAINDYDVSIIFHLAAQAIVSVANRHPFSTLLSNYVGTLNLLEAARQTRNVARIVIASSDKVYGDQLLPYSEESPMLCCHPYEVSKACCEFIVKAYNETYFKVANPKTCIAITRCVNMLGGGDFNWSRIIPRQISNALSGQGLQYNLCKRQFLYVLDAVRAYLSLAEKLDDESVNGQIFNFGSDKVISMKDLVHSLISLCNNGEKLKAYQIFYASDGHNIVQEEIAKKPVDYDEYPPGEIREQFLSSKKAFQLLGWKPLYTLQEGIKDTYYWYDNWLNKKDMKKVNEELIERFLQKQKRLQISRPMPVLEMLSSTQNQKSTRSIRQLSLQEA